MFKKLLEMIKSFLVDVWERIEDFFVGTWEEIKEWFKTPWTKFKKWQLVNILVLIIAYAGFDVDAQAGYSTVIGLWLFLLGGYYIFWKLFGFDKVWKKRREKRKKK